MGLPFSESTFRIRPSGVGTTFLSCNDAGHLCIVIALVSAVSARYGHMMLVVFAVELFYRYFLSLARLGYDCILKPRPSQWYLLFVPPAGAALYCPFADTDSCSNNGNTFFYSSYNHDRHDSRHGQVGGSFLFVCSFVLFSSSAQEARIPALLYLLASNSFLDASSRSIMPKKSNFKFP